MTPLRSSYTEVHGDETKQSSELSKTVYPVEVKPPGGTDLPGTVEDFVHRVLEGQTGLLGIKNTSPVVAYEIQRPRSNRLRIQYCVPTKRLERKIRTYLSTEIPGVGFERGATALPLAPGDSIGGGMLTTGRKDRHPFRTEFDSPPINGLAASLHRHTMRDSKFVVQILFRSVAGQPVRETWRKHRDYQKAGSLRKEKQELIGSRPATSRERKQADAVERKIGGRRVEVSVRFAVIGAGRYTPSRVKEIAGAFNIFGNPETGQYLDIHTVRGIRRKPFLGLYRAVRDREFGGYSHSFQATVDELSGLVSVPDIDQENIQNARP
jgi:hypothetical protein